MTACFFLEFFSDWITLIQSVRISLDRLWNFLNQNIGLSSISFDDWLMLRQTTTSLSVKLPKIFSARCVNPGLFNILSSGLAWAILWMFLSFLNWNWASKLSILSIKFWIRFLNFSVFLYYLLSTSTFGIVLNNMPDLYNKNLSLNFKILYLYGFCD